MKKSDVENLSIPEFPPSFYSVTDAQTRILEAAPSWLEARYRESPIIVALPKLDGIPWQTVFNCNPSDWNAERILTEACGYGQSLGINQHSFVESAFLFNASKFDPQLKNEMKQRGWTETDLEQLSQAEAKADNVRLRMRGAAGWIICQPGFLAERDELMEIWKQLEKNSHPELPLLRTIRLPQQPEETRKARSSERLEFQQQFDKFCDRWRLLGMITWDLPKIDGPKWTEHYPGRPMTLEGMTCQDTPFHFPLQSQDGLGELAKEEHDRLAEAHGFTDQSKWETYSQLLRLSFWEETIDRRYAENKQPIKGFLVNKITVLVRLLKLEEGRIVKLRKWSNQLRKGRRSSLTGVR